MKYWQTIKSVGALALGLATASIGRADNYNGFSTNDPLREWDINIYTNGTYVSNLERGLDYIKKQSSNPDAYYPALCGLAKILESLKDSDAVIPDRALETLRKEANSLKNKIRQSLRKRMEEKHPEIMNDKRNPIPNR